MEYINNHSLKFDKDATEIDIPFLGTGDYPQY